MASTWSGATLRSLATSARGASARRRRSRAAWRPLPAAWLAGAAAGAGLSGAPATSNMAARAMLLASVVPRLAFQCARSATRSSSDALLWAAGGAVCCAAAAWAGEPAGAEAVDVAGEGGCVPACWGREGGVGGVGVGRAGAGAGDCCGVEEASTSAVWMTDSLRRRALRWGRVGPSGGGDSAWPIQEPMAAAMAAVLLVRCKWPRGRVTVPWPWMDTVNVPGSVGSTMLVTKPRACACGPDSTFTHSPTMVRMERGTASGSDSGDAGEGDRSTSGEGSAGDGACTGGGEASVSSAEAAGGAAGAGAEVGSVSPVPAGCSVNGAGGGA